MRVVTLTVITILAWVPSARAFEDVLRTHGGYWNWRSYRTMRYDIVGWPFSKNMNGSDAEIVDLETGKIRIDGGGVRAPYHLGYDGCAAWVQPSAQAVAAPARFYTLVPFQFVGMPFLLADPGVQENELGYRLVDGRVYEVFSFKMDANTNAPSNSYVAYVDDDTRLLHLVVFDITFPALVNPATGQGPGKYAVVFDEWQTVDSFTVPKRMSIHEWTNGNLGTEKASFSVENVNFDHAAAVPSAFSPPDGSAIDPIN